MIPRRGLLAGLGALLAAPAIIRTPGLLMPVRPLREPLWFGVDWADDGAVTVRISGVFGAGPSQAGQIITIGSRSNVLDRDGRSNQWAREEWSVARNEGTIEAQRRLIFGDWPVVDSKFLG
jgi:hypothetical protein